MDNNENKKNKKKMQKEGTHYSSNTQFNINNKNITNISEQNGLILSSTKINSSEEEVTISPIKLMMTSASSKSTMIEPTCKLEKFLPPLNILNQNKKTLVLDLDETLIHSYFDNLPPRTPDFSFDIFIEKKKIHVSSILRPGVHEFLNNLEKIYEIVIFTASLSQYANPVLDFIDKKGICKFRLFREHCCCFTNGFSNSFIKDLKKLDRDMKNLIIIDNNPKSFMLNKENGVPIKTWIEDLNDRELFKLIPYLIFLGNEKILDVRPFLKEINTGSSLNYEKFDKIILEYNIKKEKELESELNKFNIKDINQNIFDSINSGNSINNEKENKKNDNNNDDSNDKNKKYEKTKTNKEIEERTLVKNVNNNKSINHNDNINIDNKFKEIKDKNANTKNININSETKNNNKEKNIQNINIEDQNDIPEKKEKNNFNKNKKKENKKNIPKRNVNTNKELINICKRNNSANNKENMQKFNYNNKAKNKDINSRYDNSLKEEDLLIEEYNSFDDINNKTKLIQREVKKNININNINNISREIMVISLNTISNERDNLFLKKNSFLNTYKNCKIKNESVTIENPKYNKSNELLDDIIKNINKNTSIESTIKINKSIQFSEQEKTIVNDDMEEEEKNIVNEDNNEEPIFDIIETEKNEKNSEKTKSIENEIINNEEKNEYKYKINDMVEKESKKRKKRKINKNLFNKGKAYKFIQKKDKDFDNKLFLNINNKNQDPLKDKPDYLSKKNIGKNILNHSTRRKRENIINNISSSNYKIFKEKEKPNLFLKNNSNINNGVINLFISKNKSMSKHNSNIFNIQNNLNGTKTIKNKFYMMKKEREEIGLFGKNKENNYIFKGSGLTKRPTSYVNKKHESLLNNSKRTINFSKQDKKIYLKTNNEKKNEIKKTKINLDYINNMGINLDRSIKNENEETKENKIDNKRNKNTIIDSYSNPARNIITDIFFVKNLEERNNKNILDVNELKDNNKNKCIQN